MTANASPRRGSWKLPALPMKWLAAWGISWRIAFPTVLVVLPLVRRIAAAVVESSRSGH